MSHINRSANFNDDDDRTDPLNNVPEHESTTTSQMNSPGCISIPPQQPTPVAQMVADERTNHLDPITNQRMNETTVYELIPRPSSTSVNEHDIPGSVTRPWTEDSPLNYVFAANRDQQPNNRISYPSDTLEQILINLLIPSLRRSLTNVMRNIIPLSIEDTQPHTMPMPVYLNTFLQDVITHNENGDINEDGTVPNDTDENINSSPNGHSQMILTESQGTEPTDEITYNGNPAVSTDVQDDSHRGVSNEERSNIEFESNTQYEDVSSNSNTQDNVPLTASIPSLPVVTTRIESSGQATDVDLLLAGPTENPALLFATDSDATLTNTNTPKQTVPFNSNGERTVE